jgi:glycosyltransferase involved in cell wall biosynthesis
MRGAVSRHEDDGRAAPKCSIVITNYNYECYLAQAIESALAQDSPSVEVVVVDDGSTDGSPWILDRYESQATIVRKQNGGEASARNAGLRHSTGDIVIFVDADDYLYPDAVSRCVAAFGPNVAKVHYPLDIVDGEGRKTGEIMAASLCSGDMTGLLRRFGFYPSPPTSGNAYSRRALERIGPIPESEFRRGADTYQIALTALYGEVRALDRPCAAWRRHGKNTSKHNISTLLGKLVDDIDVVDLVNAFLRKRNGHAHQAVAAWPQHLQQRLTVAKLLPDQRVKYDDTVAGLALRYVNSVWRWPAYNLRKRMAATVWAFVFAMMPGSIASPLSNATRMTSLVYRFIR